jgi:hypothetical protein
MKPYTGLKVSIVWASLLAVWTAVLCIFEEVNILTRIAAGLTLIGAVSQIVHFTQLIKKQRAETDSDAGENDKK